MSGAERVLLLLLSRLNRTRFEATLICPAGGQLQKAARGFNVPCVEVQQLTARFTWKLRALFHYLSSFISTIRQVRTRVREQQPDLIHANSIRAGLVISVATFGLRIPIVWHVHDLLPAHPLSTCIRWFVLFHPPARIVVVAQAACDRFKGKVLRVFAARVKIDVIHNAVDISEVISGHGRSIRRELRLRNDDKLIGIVGNLSPIKGQLELLGAFARVRANFPNSALLVVGSTLFNSDEGYQQRLHAEVRRLNLESQVRFVGQRDDVPAIMAALDLLVINSRSEAFPLVALEGMAAGVPILATSVGGLPELIKHKENGWLIEAGNSEALVSSLNFLLRRPGLCGDMSKAAGQHVETNHSVPAFIAQVESTYNELHSEVAPLSSEQLALSSSAS